MTTLHQHTRQRGFALITTSSLMMPVLVVAMATSLTMAGESTRELRDGLTRQLARLAAQAGAEDAIWRANVGELEDGKSYTRDLRTGHSYQVEATNLGDAFQVIVTGTYGHTSHRLAGCLRPVRLLPKMHATLAAQNSDLKLQGTVLVSGTDVKSDGTRGSTPTMPGLATTTLDVRALASQIRSAANVVLTEPLYSSYCFGDSSRRTANITYRNGDVTFAGDTRGAGVLIVTGDLRITDNFRFDGVIIVLGKIIHGAGSAKVLGSVLLGPDASEVQAEGNLEIHYSSQGIHLANLVSGTYIAFDGWRELVAK